MCTVLNINDYKKLPIQESLLPSKLSFIEEMNIESDEFIVFIDNLFKNVIVDVVDNIHDESKLINFIDSAIKIAVSTALEKVTSGSIKNAAKSRISSELSRMESIILYNNIIFTLSSGLVEDSYIKFGLVECVKNAKLAHFLFILALKGKADVDIFKIGYSSILNFLISDYFSSLFINLYLNNKSFCAVYEDSKESNSLIRFSSCVLELAKIFNKNIIDDESYSVFFKFYSLLNSFTRIDNLIALSYE